MAHSEKLELLLEENLMNGPLLCSMGMGQDNIWLAPVSEKKV